MPLSGGEVSWWLRGVGRTRAPLEGAVEADVVIVGGGFTGLWTAWYLTRLEPSLRVVVLEAEHVGYGGSGRNGGWCSAGLGVTLGELERRVGRPVARRVAAVMRGTVDEVGRVCAAEGIAAAFRKGGVLRIARGAHELPVVERDWEVLCRLQLDDGCARLDADAVAARVRVGDARAAVFDPNCAALDPGALVVGLAAAVERAGVAIHEGTRVTEVVPRRPDGLPGASVLAVEDLDGQRGPGGSVTARAVVLAGEAWMPRLAGYRRALLPVYSLIVLTEPVPEATWREIGWEGHECLSSRRYTVDYLSRTVDGRILFGGRGAPYHLGSRVAPRFDHHEPTHAGLRSQLRSWFPQLEGVGIAAEWGGAIGMPRDWMPSVAFDAAAGVAHAFGYTGQGVATANLAGRILAQRLVQGASEWDDLPFVDHPVRPWEPEPLRWLAARAMQIGLARIDARAARTGEPPTGRSLPERLIRH